MARAHMIEISRPIGTPPEGPPPGGTTKRALGRASNADQRDRRSAIVAGMLIWIDPSGDTDSPYEFTATQAGAVVPVGADEMSRDAMVSALQTSASGEAHG